MHILYIYICTRNSIFFHIGHHIKQRSTKSHVLEFCFLRGKPVNIFHLAFPIPFFFFFGLQAFPIPIAITDSILRRPFPLTLMNVKTKDRVKREDSVVPSINLFQQSFFCSVLETYQTCNPQQMEKRESTNNNS